MRRRYAAASALGLLTLALASSSEAAPQRLSHMGRWLVDEQGRVVLLHGGNVGALAGIKPDAQAGDRPAWSDALPRRMAQAGINGVRLFFFFDRVMPKPGQIDRHYLDAIARTVAAYQAAGIYVLLDFHQDEYGPSVGLRGLPAWATLTDGHERVPGLPFPNGYFSDPAVQHAFDNFWADKAVPGTGRGVQEFYLDGLTAVGRRFARDPAVFGIDVMNEPATGSRCAQPDPAAANCPELETALLAPFYAKIGKALKAAAPHTLIFVEPFMLQGALGLPLGTPSPGVPALNGLSYHNYGPFPEFRNRTNDSAVARATAIDAAVLNTEWGNTKDAGEISRQAQDFDDRFISWLAWSEGPFEALFDAKPSAEAAATLRAFARPFPAATAGTPERLRFDPSSGRMEYAYATVGPDGRALPAGAVTVIHVPPPSFPEGYAVTVTHGSAVSPPGAALLTVKAEPRAQEVEVRVERLGASPEPSKAPPQPQADGPAGRLSTTSLLAELLRNPQARAIVEQRLPDLVNSPQIGMATQMTLRQLRPYLPMLNDQLLAEMDAALAQLPAN